MLKNFKSGFVAIIGRPNVGKSTLLNSLVKNKISIVSKIPQTTRHNIRGILNLKNAQIVFIDTPGIHSFKDKLSNYLNDVAKNSINDIDLILYLVDISRPIGKEEIDIMNFLVNQEYKIVMALNKIDLTPKYINDYINKFKEILEEKNKQDKLLYYIPISAKTFKNIDVLIKVILENLKEQEPFYDFNTITDFPIKFRIADIIREKLFLSLKEELPHSLAVEVEDILDRGFLKEDSSKYPIYIKVNIYVNRLSQKKIVIGQNASLIKYVGETSRKEVESLLNRKIYLDIRVKVLEDWQDKPRILQELGYF